MDFLKDLNPSLIFRIIIAAGLFLPLLAVSGIDAHSDKGAVEKRRLKILVNNPSVGWSHMQFQGRLADLLSEAGHEVHLLVQTTILRADNYTGTSRGQPVRWLHRPREKESDFVNIPLFTDMFGGPSNLLLDGSMRGFNRVSAEECEEMLAASELLAELEHEHYDVGISEGMHPCAFGVFKRIGVRSSIATYALVFASFQHYLYGLPTFPSWDTSLFAPSLNGPAMNFGERAFSFYMQLMDQFWERPAVLRLHQEIFERRFGAGFPSLKEVFRNISLVFLNENEFLQLPRVISNKVISIGGILDSPSRSELSDRAKQILDRAESGVVLFSFGTLANPSNMSESMKRAFFNAFARFPTYEFIWKHKLHPNDSTLPIPPNVHLFEWVEQKALLQHPRLRAFITHCGLNSVNEAARAGVPLVGVPLFGDQPYNAALMNVKGVGVHLDIRECSNEAPIAHALEKVLRDPSYAHNAKLVSRKLRLSPFSPAERFVRWVEFAADYPELNELNLPYHEFSFLTYYCLDVVAFTLAGAMVALLATLWVMKSLVHGIMAVATIKEKKCKRE